MNKLGIGSRIILGLIFFIFGLNGFLQFLPAQPALPENALAFIMGLVNTGYMMKFIKGVEVLVGLALLLNIYSALALVVIAPIVINILLFHTILAPAGAGMAIAITILTLVSAYAQKEKYAALLKMK